METLWKDSRPFDQNPMRFGASKRSRYRIAVGCGSVSDCRETRVRFWGVRSFGGYSVAAPREELRSELLTKFIANKQADALQRTQDIYLFICSFQEEVC